MVTGTEYVLNTDSGMVEERITKEVVQPIDVPALNDRREKLVSDNQNYASFVSVNEEEIATIDAKIAKDAEVRAAEEE